jgi:hypothetical protein
MSDHKTEGRKTAHTNNKPAKKKKKNKTDDIVSYRKQYMEGHKEVWYQKITCPICGVEFAVANKTNHNRTMKHRYATLKQEVETLKKDN